jgi:hypothetical protein
MPSLFRTLRFSGLCYTLVRKEAQRIQVQNIREPEDYFLDASYLQLGQTAADRLGTANQRPRGHRAAQQRGREFGPRLLVGLADTAEGPCRAVDALVIAPDGFTVGFEHGELVLDRLQIAKHITGIGVLRDQFEGHLLAATANQDRDMRLLDPLGLVDRAMYLVVFALEDGFFLRPHCQDHLHRLAETPQARSRIRIVVAIAAILVFVPASPDTEVKSPVREHIDCARHFGEQSGIAIAVARDRLTNADAPGITRQGGGGRPALKRDFLRWPWGCMKVVDKPGRRETYLRILEERSSSS